MDKKLNENVYNCLLNPVSIAVIGASTNIYKPGGRVFKNIKENGFKGPLWPVNPKTPEILDLPVYQQISDLPKAPDLALICIPAPFVMTALMELADKGTRAVIILTAGFGETSEKGKAEEKRIVEFVQSNGMIVAGPNCSGFLTPCYAGKFAGIIPELETGSIDFISGSGATVDYVMEQAVPRGLKFSHVFNLGNSIQLGVEDMVMMLDIQHGPDSAGLMLLYMEAVNQPEKLLKHARSLTSKGCTIIAIKSGVTVSGTKAAASHTGAMASSDRAVQALFDKAGIIRVSSKMELIEAACAVKALQGLPKGRRACIITDAGGPGVMLSDELDRQGIELPGLSDSARSGISKLLPEEASLENPIDCLPSRTGQQIKEIFQVLEGDEKNIIDFMFLVTGNSEMSDNWEIYTEIIELRKKRSMPVIPVLSSLTTCAALIDKVKQSGTPFFLDEVSAGRAVGQIINRPRLSEPGSRLDNYDRRKISEILKSENHIVSQDAVEKILRAAGFSLPPQTAVSNVSDLEAACLKTGFPVAMKAIGPLHKSDVGGVKTSIRDMSEARLAWNMLNAIPDTRGVLVQKMVDGLEMILGAVKEEDFGHLIMFGLGGIYTEVLKDVKFSLAPLSHEEAFDLIHNIQSFPLLEGVRGAAGVSLEKVADCLLRLSCLVTDFPDIQEVDLNPVKGIGEALSPIDARIILKNCHTLKGRN